MSKTSGSKPSLPPFVNRHQPTLQYRVRWRHSKVVQAGIDQTRLAIANAPTPPTGFSFLVLGDTDSGPYAHFATHFAEQIKPHMEASQLVLHTGDIVYPLGSYRNYLAAFLQPYHSLLTAVPSNPAYSGDRIIFNKPFLPVPGNHDYADLPTLPRAWLRLFQPFCDGLRQTLKLDLGCYGGYGGQAYGQTFLDDLERLGQSQALTNHLAVHYREQTATGYGLSYEPGRFTRLPNRYYTFRYGGVDFFALDSNTWIQSSSTPQKLDTEQLQWLEQRLIESWHTPDVIGRVIYLHHSPYTTEETRWQEPETLRVRRNLRSVLDNVAIAIEPLQSQRSQSQRPQTPIVDLILSGHAHCLEHIRSGDTGHADANLDWFVCGGSGDSLRRQRKTGSDILEMLSYQGRNYTNMVAQSQLYVGAKGQGQLRQFSYTFLRIDVQPKAVSPFIVNPFVVTQLAGTWETRALSAIALQPSFLQPKG